MRRTALAQNGITAQNGAKVQVLDSSIVDLAFTGPTVFTATGVLLFGGGDSEVINTDFANVQTGVYAFSQTPNADFVVGDSFFSGQVNSPGGYKDVIGVYGYRRQLRDCGQQLPTLSRRARMTTSSASRSKGAARWSTPS